MDKKVRSCKTCDKDISGSHGSTKYCDSCGPRSCVYHAAYQRQRRVKNRDQVNKYHRDYYLRNLANQRARARIRRFLGAAKKDKSQELLGDISKQQYKEYLLETYRLQYGRSLVNWGRQVHIDHIIPLSAFSRFDCELSQRMAFHFSNTRLIKAKHNLRKRSSLPGGLDMQHRVASGIVDLRVYCNIYNIQLTE